MRLRELYDSVREGQYILITKSKARKERFVPIPEKPGLSYEIDWDAVQRYRVDKPARRPDPPRLIETSWPDGRRMYIANSGRVNEGALNP